MKSARLTRGQVTPVMMAKVLDDLGVAAGDEFVVAPAPKEVTGSPTLPDRRYDGATTTADDVPRLDSQLGRVFALMRDGEWRTPAEVEAATGDNWASASARLRDLRKSKFGDWVVDREGFGAGLFKYRLREATPADDEPQTLGEPPAPTTTAPANAIFGDWEG